jgi:AcrR family transcriptional regulator
MRLRSSSISRTAERFFQRVSKRDLYALFKNKHAVLAACIGERTQQMRLPLDPAVPIPQTRSALEALLVELGVSILKTVCHPQVLTVFRLAIAESDRAPEIARALDNSGRAFRICSTLIVQAL